MTFLEWQGERLLLRAVDEGDRAFVFGTWLRSYRPLQRAVAHDAYYAGQRRRVDRLWAQTIAACSSTKPITIHAWACGSLGLLHYVYVPPDLQQRGLARALVDAVCGPELEFTHRWPFERTPRGWRFNEYRLED